MQTFRNIKRLDSLKLTEAPECYGVIAPIYTGDQNIRMKILELPETIKEIVDTCAIIKKNGLKLIVEHMFDIPTESEMSNDISQNLYAIIKPDIIECRHFVYTKGSPAVKHALRLGLLTPAQVKSIEAGIPYQPKSNFYQEYAKSYTALPVGGLIAELLPMKLIEFIAKRKAGL